MKKKIICLVIATLVFFGIVIYSWGASNELIFKENDYTGTIKEKDVSIDYNTKKITIVVDSNTTVKHLLSGFIFDGNQGPYHFFAVRPGSSVYDENTLLIDLLDKSWLEIANGWFTSVSQYDLIIMLESNIKEKDNNTQLEINNNEKIIKEETIDEIDVK